MICIAVLSVFAIPSCQKDKESLVDLTAIIAEHPNDGAKVTIDDQRYVCWSNEDTVSINGEKYYVGRLTADGVTSVTISGVTYNEDGYAAVYPYSCHKTENAGSTTATIILPDVQKWNASHITTPMVAYTTGSTLTFRNPCNSLKVKVTNDLSEDLFIHQIVITSTNTILTGEATVTGINGTPTINNVTGGTKDVTLDCNNQSVVPGESNAYTFYVTVPKVSGEQFRFRVLAKTSDGTKYTFDDESRDGISLTQNQMVPISISLGLSNSNGDNNFWGSGSEPDPFLITEADDLYKLRNLITHTNLAEEDYDDDKYNTSSVYYIQTSNIDISTQSTWGQSSNYAIGNSSHAFLANYNGGSHSVNLGITSAVVGYPTGIFGVVGTCHIHHLNVSGSIATGDVFAVAGGICGKIVGNTKINNCYSSINITNTHYNSANNDTTYGVGGIVGVIHSGNFKISTCKYESSGCISVYRLPAGGICGRIKGTVCGDCTDLERCIQDCINEGTVRVAYFNNNDYTNGQIGGICGVVRGGKVKISQCTNNGSILLDLPSNNSASGFHAGGIVGQNGTTLNGENTSQLTILRCLNKGVIKMVKNNAAYISIGGILGRNMRQVLISECLNYSPYSMYGGTKSNYTAIGGILGCAQKGTATIRNCTNKTTIETAWIGGGIVGREYVYSSSPTIVIENCICNCQMSSSNITYAGGVCGREDATAGTNNQYYATATYKNCIIAIPTDGSCDLTATIVALNYQVNRTTIRSIFSAYAFHNPTDLPVYKKNSDLYMRTSYSDYYKTFDNEGASSSADVTTCSDLATALNAWIDAQGTPANYTRWTTTGSSVPEMSFSAGCTSF